jgi:hypothetical protein
MSLLALPGSLALTARGTSTGHYSTTSTSSLVLVLVQSLYSCIIITSTGISKTTTPSSAEIPEFSLC